MPAAAAAVLLDRQPVLVLEKENYALREENRHLHFEVHELMAWKERALKQLVALGPKRNRARRDVEHATQLQRQLQTVEQSLLERTALADANAELETARQQLHERVQTLEIETTMLQERLMEMEEREATARRHVQELADGFRTHLEQLVAMRERIDDSGQEEIESGVAIKEEDQPSDPERASLDSTDEDGREDAALLIAGLGAVSDKCLRWFHQHVAQTFSQLQEKAALYEAQHTELETLRTRVHAIRSDVDRSVAKEKQQNQQLLKIQHDKAALEREIETLRTRHVHASRGHAAMSDYVRLLVTEVRQYLRLVRAEIKKKFGYVPDAITHTDNWARILDAMDVLERQLRLTHA